MNLSSTESPFLFEATSQLKDREWSRHGDGIATFSTHKDDLWLEEAGQWSDAQESSALQGAMFKKHLVFRKADEGGLEILKPDPEGDLQPLLTVYPEPEGLHWKSEDPHVCIEDLYTAEVTLTDSDELQVIWTATGPQKDYTTISRYPKATLFRTWLNA